MQTSQTARTGRGRCPLTVTALAASNRLVRGCKGGAGGQDVGRHCVQFAGGLVGPPGEYWEGKVNGE